MCLLGGFTTAYAQYDGAPVDRTKLKQEEKKEIKRAKYPTSENDWENFNVLHINRLPSAATFISYPARDLALKGEKELSGYYKSLNG